MNTSFSPRTEIVKHGMWYKEEEVERNDIKFTQGSEIIQESSGHYYDTQTVPYHSSS